MAHAEILLVEDDASFGQSLVDRLTQESFSVAWAKTLDAGRKQWKASKPQLVILDVGLPDGSGFDLAREIKKESPVPLIFMTAWNSAENRLEGYEIGAEEFIPKPFHFRELLLRVQHVLESHPVSKVLSLPEGDLDLDKMCFTGKQGQMTFLANRDFQVLKLLIDAAPKALTRDEILDRAWGQEAFPSHRTIDNTIVRLRQALRDDAGDLIRSVRGVGYQWVYT